jgi:SAM-dependent methyltransferase
LGVLEAVPFLDEFYPESRFGGFSKVDGTIAFFSRVNALVSREATALDVGCGRGEYADDPVAFRRNLRILKGKCTRVIGIDVDPNARVNPYLDSFELIQGDRWPIADQSIDVCVCDHVVEHVEDVPRFFSECGRVLKAGGYLCIRTPNANSYVALAARLISNKYHARVLSKVQERRKPEDVFPTLYRCNTRARLERALAGAGFGDCVTHTHEAEPSYLSFSKAFYWLGVMHQRFAPSYVKPALFAFARKVSAT